jgi:predicted GNAT family acetyltransferase
MPPLNNARIQKGEQNMFGQRYHIDADEGYVNADLAPDDATYRISFYRVHDKYQGQGYGKELLELAKEHAKSIGAQVITSSNITSNESAGTMSNVFGYRYITGGVDPKTVSSLVDLFPEVTLNYPVSVSDLPLRDDVQVLPGFRAPSNSPIRKYWDNRDQ